MPTKRELQARVGTMIGTPERQMEEPKEGWIGLPTRLAPLLEYGEIRDLYFPEPMLAVALSGRGRRWYTSCSKTRELYSTPGSFEMHAAGSYMDRGRWESEPGGKVLAIEFPSKLLECLQGEGSFPLRLRTQHNVFNESMFRLTTLLWHDASSGGMNGPLFTQGLTIALVGMLCEHYGGTRERVVGRHDALTPAQRARLLDYIDERLSTPIAIDHLAALVGMTPSSFVRAFRASFEQSPYAFVLDRRIQVAGELLRDRRDCSIADVAVLCGFANQAHFTEAFRRRKSITPLRWRREQG